jgi:RNA polymerase sigma-70 factor (ECF subfamily)
MAETPDDVEGRLEYWVRRTLPKAITFARSVTSDFHEAEDLVQDCFARLLAKRSEYDLPADGWKLLLRSITHAAIDRRRRRKPLRLDVDEDGRSKIDGLALAREPEPISPLMTRELQKKIDIAIESLPWIQRTVIELKGQGLSLQEIADAVTITPNHVGVVLYRARAAMYHLLQDWFKAED